MKRTGGREIVSIPDWWPSRIRDRAKFLVAGHGWGPTMLFIACGGCMLILQATVKIFPNLGWLAWIEVGSWGTWIVVSLIAMLMTLRHSVRAITRLGLAGLTRPRWWFELSRSSWTLFVLAIGSSFLSWFVKDRKFAADVWFAFKLIAGCGLVLFFQLAVIGYLLSFARGLPRSGRAYDCVHFFFNILGSIMLTSYAIVLWPNPPQAERITASLALGIVGVLWLTAAFVTIIQRYEKSERHRVVR